MHKVEVYVYEEKYRRWASTISDLTFILKIHFILLTKLLNLVKQNTALNIGAFRNEVMKKI